MEKAELELVKLDNGDVITTSGGVNYVFVSGLGNNNPKDALFTGVYNGQDLYFDNAEATYGEGLNDYLISIFDGKSAVFKMKADDNVAFSFGVDFYNDFNNNDDSTRASRNGYYEWDSLQGLFVWQRAQQ